MKEKKKERKRERLVGTVSDTVIITKTLSL